jgi:hypothetical protein
MEKLNNALREDTKDPDAYFDCMSCSEWLADWENRDRYSRKAMELEMHTGVLKALGKYIDDNGIKNHPWTDKQKNDFDNAFKTLVNICNGIIDTWEENK